MAQTRRLRSYSFDSSQSLTGGKQPQQTRIRGSAVRPSSLAYDLTLGGKTEQVIRIGARSYLRIPPAGWKSVARPAAVDPLMSLLQLLRQCTPQTVTSSTSSRTLTGTVPGAALTAAGLAPAAAQAPTQTPVTVTLDPTGHVTGLSVALDLRAGSITLHLVETSRYGSFNKAPAIRPPGKLRSRPISH